LLYGILRSDNSTACYPVAAIRCGGFLANSHADRVF
jgi:hypothetical protein